MHGHVVTLRIVAAKQVNKPTGATMERARGSFRDCILHLDNMPSRSFILGSRHPTRSARLVVIAALALSGTAEAVDQNLWVGAWGFPSTSAASPVTTNSSTATAAGGEPLAPPNLDNVTVRQIVRISAAAARLRIRISNEFSEHSLRLGSVHVALAGSEGASLPGSDHVVTFSGASSAVVPAGAPVVSDPVDWIVPALSQLAVSVYLPEATKRPAHQFWSYVSSVGDFTAAERMSGAQLVRTGALVSVIEIVSPTARRTVVALGDSITEGFGSTTNQFKGWTDQLAERFAGNPRTRAWSLVSAGINSNRLLHDNPGMNALARFDRDVLSVPSVGAVILLEGINDIGYSHMRPEEAVTADDIIAAYKQLIARAHAHCISIFGATLTPFEDSHYFDPQGEQMREAVNSWIRGSKAFDAVIDFDAALRDPGHPTSVISSLQRGDHLHPNDAGYSKMAAAIDLKLFESREPRCTIR
jgi:lysophospholipase L1-like esterase